jgi:hypothetical protein
MEWPTALRTGTDGRHDDRLPEANGGTATQLERPRAGDARRTYGFQIRSCRSRRFRPVAIGRRNLCGLNIAGVCALCLALLSARERAKLRHSRTRPPLVVVARHPAHRIRHVIVAAVGMRDGVPANRARATLKPYDLALKAIIARQDDAATFQNREEIAEQFTLGLLG